MSEGSADMIDSAVSEGSILAVEDMFNEFIGDVPDKKIILNRTKKDVN